MKKILGLDLGTNSIGWAVVQTDENENLQTISGMGSRIIPMDAAVLGDFDRGNTISQTKNRTGFRGIRRLRERHLQRRERLHRVLNILEFLPEHYAQQIGWSRNEPKSFGKFLDDKEPKLAWKEIIRDNKKSFEFLFESSFNEMLGNFAANQSELLLKGKKIPKDWTIYYLRKKALINKISKEELAWILLHFNQKRGYYQLRGEDDAIENKREFVVELEVVKVEEGEIDKKNKKKRWYNITLENAWMYSATFFSEPKWLHQRKEFLVTEELDENGKIKLTKDTKNYEGGKELRKITPLPSFEEIDSMSQADQDKIYKKIKAKTEAVIKNTGKTVGAYIYDTLLEKPSQKIRGQLVRTIERKFYREELIQILQSQSQFHSELQDRKLYDLCIRELYKNNEGHRNNIDKLSFTDLFVKDIIFYQRPLKSKKSLISDCPFEMRYSDKGEKFGIKCIAKSHPLFQEFRLWKFVTDLKIYQREKEVDGKLKTDVLVTDEFLKTEDDLVALFEWLNERKEVNQDTLLGSFFKIKKEKGEYPYRWNYVDKAYPCNETRTLMKKKLEEAGITLETFSAIGSTIIKEALLKLKEKIGKVKSEKHKKALENAIKQTEKEFFFAEKMPIYRFRKAEESLWHILYSVEDKEELKQALKTFAIKCTLPTKFVTVFENYKPFKKEYTSFSAKAIKKMLSLMRKGEYWSVEGIDENTRQRIDKIISGEFDEKIKNRVREKAINLTEVAHFRSLPEWLASYIIYDRFSEAKEIKKWETPEQLDGFIRKFKQHSLRNPIVEQIILETLRTVRDIWEKEGQIDEIHVELGREMKNPADKRKQMTEQIIENENGNLRIKAMLMEFKNEGLENVRPYSPTQQDIFKIYEEYALNSGEKYDAQKDRFVEDAEIPDYVSVIMEKFKKKGIQEQPTQSEINRYKCWLEQRYCSPYTGKMIPLAKLFTSAYEIEHIIPQSRYFDDSFSNKVICESEVNKLKNNQLGYEFIKNHGGEKIELSLGGTVEIRSVEAYEKFVKANYAKNRGKMKKLLMDDIPDTFIERQLNDTRYISKEIKTLLSNIVRQKEENGEYEQEAVSKNVISCTGGITDKLKKDWGLNDVWNRIIYPRFERLNTLTESKHFGDFENKDGKRVFQIKMPIELQKGFNKKRIDHRHHALDALVIACASREHVQYLNNESAKSGNYLLQRGLAKKLREFEEVEFSKKVRNVYGVWVDSKEKIKKEVPKVFLKPWDHFTQDAEKELEKMIVSFKQNLRVINKTENFYEKYVENSENGKKEKKRVAQDKQDNWWAIRKPMHKDTVFALVNLQKKKTLGLSMALKTPKSIVEKDLKTKILDLLEQGWDEKRIKKYFSENKDIWKDINLSKIEVYYFSKDANENYMATRKSLASLFAQMETEEKVRKVIESITDTGIQQILLTHLHAKNGNPKLAFSSEGIEEMNQNIKVLNKGKNHHPIFKVRVSVKSENKFAIGKKGNRSSKFVEAAKGTNLFFAVYEKENSALMDDVSSIKREFAAIPFNVVIDFQKKTKENPNQWKELLDEYVKDDERKLISKDSKFLFILSPNDLVYLPTQEERISKKKIEPLDRKRIYKFVSSSGIEAKFVSHSSASTIFSLTKAEQVKKGLSFDIQDEYGIGSQDSKNQKALTGEMIKDLCIPIKVDRLGNKIETDKSNSL